jgi:uncharacterized membrane protein HdeD (DUF308 family)
VSTTPQERRSSRAERLWTIGPFVAVVVASLVVLFNPGSATPAVWPGVDKVIHMAMFAALALTGRRAGLPTPGLAVGLVVYAGASEVLQALLPLDRDGDPLDALVDVVGVVAGLLVARWVVPRSAAAPHER